MWLVVQDFQLKKYFKKQQILDEIIVNLVDNETLEEEEALEYVSKEEVSEALKIKQMELELQREIKEKKLISERELQREIEEKKKMISEREKQEKEIQIREKEIQLQKEIKERALETRILLKRKIKYNILTLLNTFVLFLFSMKMKLESIFFFSKK